MILLFIVITLIPLLDLLHPGLLLTHDGQDHVARIANFYQNLIEGNIIPRWAGNLNWGYGTPILMFLYPLPSYIASLFHFIGFSLVDSTKFVFGVAYILSGLTMYLWINEFLGKRAAFVSGMLYLFAPYRFVDLYVRGAIGEHVAFIFPPLICYFLLKLSKGYSYWYLVGGALSLGFLILSHNAISLMFLPLVFLYSSFLLWQTKNESPRAYARGIFFRSRNKMLETDPNRLFLKKDLEENLKTNNIHYIYTPLSIPSLLNLSNVKQVYQNSEETIYEVLE